MIVILQILHRLRRGDREMKRCKPKPKVHSYEANPDGQTRLLLRRLRWFSTQPDTDRAWKPLGRYERAGQQTMLTWARNYLAHKWLHKKSRVIQYCVSEHGLPNLLQSETKNNDPSIHHHHLTKHGSPDPLSTLEPLGIDIER